MHRDGAEVLVLRADASRRVSSFDESAFVDGENAIVDFKYSASPKVTWWFDHHQSAFLTPEDQRDFLAWQEKANRRCGVRKPCRGGKFYDPTTSPAPA